MSPGARQFGLGVAVVVVPLGLAGTALGHAQRAGRVDAADARRVVALLGFSDLALSSGARWLRHPSLAEPWAAVTDAPAGFDVEPAGALVTPPGSAAELPSRSEARR